MPQLIIHEYENSRIIGTTEIFGENFQEVSAGMINTLLLCRSAAYIAELCVKWFAGPIMVGDDYGFDVRQYENTVGVWTDFLYRP